MSKTRASGRTVGGLRSLSLQAPAVTLLLLWMLVPLGMTVWFSLQRYNLLMPGMESFAGLENYEYLFTDPALWRAMGNTLLLVGSVLVITVGGGVLLAVLFQQEFPGRGIARVLAISPFFVMPTVSALVWKNMMMHPSNGVLAWLAGVFGLPAVDWFSSLPLTSIIIIVAWQWLPFALLILLTAMQSLDDDQVEAARMDGAGPIAVFFYITLPHLKRAISVVIMIEMIFLLTIFAEIYVTTSGGPGLATTNLAFLIYIQALLDFDVGLASAGGVVAIILANIVAIFLVRLVARNLES
ncbi:sugar ABC transporter permease [Halomonas sp. MCCC 1A17488]|uniref:Sugar ABC transporter permease n=1 Tax=Billgrantia sulfidoxydans TaxID=2733484 RepID=A0ABX7W2F9_9GAMM|nr:MULTISPECIES: sugar ABC transporter permease [Halomonas]MCE8015970.1 sugar ABC transporter permease [Halomonas sp. MCCC 1A17488]MCG3239303.1 sugar ABC transporter permease [Halomonas sp. MCCC 1A17488]QPP50765.1 sugar ABC transporter permease [Halomonas sp. SS10-MC5]QTP54340.1 sugar ABC transporter permease [Halomonas sulfidoxydans]